MASSRKLARFSFVALIAALYVLLGACGSTDSAPTDGDGDHPDNGTCETTVDCEVPLVCDDGFCVDPDDPDGDIIECTSNFQCPLEMKCNTALGRCVPLNEDGDEPVDGDTSDGETPDGDTPDGDAPDGDTPDGDADGDSDGDLDGDADEGEPSPINIYFVKPADGAVVDGEVVVEVDVISDLDIDRVEFFAMGSKIAELTSSPWVVFWQTGSVEERQVELRAVAYAGDEVKPALNVVTVDHSDPTVTIVKPEEDAVLGFYDDLDITIEAGDNLSQINVYVDNELIGTSPVESVQAQYELSYSLAALAPGGHNLRVEVTDKVGDHEAGYDSVLFRVDEDDPIFDIDGVTWQPGDPDSGEVFAETPLTFRIDDVSGLATARLTVTDGVRTLIDISDPTQIPYEVEHFNDLLSWPYVVYPITLTISASATDNFGNQASFNKTVTVRRLKWTYDPVQGNPDFDPGAAFQQITGAAGGRYSGNIYAALYNEIHAISGEGLPLWHCAAEQIFGTAPVVVEQESGPTLVMAVTTNGKIYTAVVDDGLLIDCVKYEPDINLENPTPPAVDVVQNTQTTTTATFYQCSKKLANTVCYKLTVTYDSALSGKVSPISYSKLWDRTYTGYSPPSNLALPRGSSTFTKPLLSAGKRMMLIDPTNGNESSVADFNASEVVQAVSAIPGSNMVAGCSEKSCRAYSWVLQSRGAPIALSSTTQDTFLGAQLVSDDEGTVVVPSALVRNEVLTGMVQAVASETTGFTGFLWEFATEGLPGGAPAIGPGGLAYVAGQNANGNIWALKIAQDAGDYQRKKYWQVKLLTGIYAPLAISPAGDLIVVGVDAKIRAVDIRGDAPLSSQACWPQSHSEPWHSGYYWP